MSAFLTLGNYLILRWSSLCTGLLPRRRWSTRRSGSEPGVWRISVPSVVSRRRVSRRRTRPSTSPGASRYRRSTATMRSGRGIAVGPPAHQAVWTLPQGTDHPVQTIAPARTTMRSGVPRWLFGANGAGAWWPTSRRGCLGLDGEAVGVGEQVQGKVPALPSRGGLPEGATRSWAPRAAGRPNRSRSRRCPRSSRRSARGAGLPSGECRACPPWPYA
jgi:hypothetical protein